MITNIKHFADSINIYYQQFILVIVLKKGDRYMKLGTLVINDMHSVQKITEGLILNGYEVTIKCVKKEFPALSGIDHFEIFVVKDDGK